MIAGVIISLAGVVISFVVMFTLRAGLKQIVFDKKQRTIQFFSDPNNAALFSKFTNCISSYRDERTGEIKPFRATKDKFHIAIEIIVPYLQLYERFSIGIKQNIYDLETFIDYNKTNFVSFEYPFVKEYVGRDQKKTPLTGRILLNFIIRLSKINTKQISHSLIHYHRYLVVRHSVGHHLLYQRMAFVLL